MQMASRIYISKSNQSIPVKSAKLRCPNSPPPLLDTTSNGVRDYIFLSTKTQIWLN